MYSAAKLNNIEIEADLNQIQTEPIPVLQAVMEPI